MSTGNSSSTFRYKSAFTADITVSVAAGYATFRNNTEAKLKYEFDSKLIMLAELTIKPEKRDAFLDYTVENLAISRSAAGNIEFDILIDASRPDCVLFYEVWESAEAQKAYMAWRVERGDLTTLMSFLAGEPKFTALNRIAT